MNTKTVLYLFIFFISFLSAVSVNAQDEEIDKLLDLNVSDLINLEIVTASKVMQKANEVPATVRVVTQETIRQNGYITLEDVLSDLQGFQFRNILGFNSYDFQRGIPNQNNLTLLLVDGIQINELNSGGFYGGGQFNLDNVERIEVVYGPASALYGTNAVSGIINIITKSPKDSPGFDANIIYGSFNTGVADAGYRFYDKEKEFGFSISGLYKTSTKANLKGSEGDNNWSDKMENFEDDISLDAKLLYKDFAAGFTFQDKRASRTTNDKSVGTHYLDSGSSWNIDFLTAYIKHNLSLNESMNLSSQIYYRNTTVLDNTVGYVLDTLQAGYYRPNDLIGVEEMLSYKINDEFSLIGGLVYESENLAMSFSTTRSNSANTAPPKPPKPAMENNSLLSFYVQSRYNFGEYFNLYAGLRYDNSSVYDEVLTPRAGLVFNYDKLGAKLLYTSAYRAPKPWDYTSGLGNSALKPEKMQSFEITASYDFTKHLHSEISFYHNILRDQLNQINASGSYYWDNKGKTTVEGIEYYSEYVSGNLKFYANYTYNYSIADGTGILPEIAKNSANFGIRYNFTDKISAGLRNNFYGDKLNPKIISSTRENKIDAALVSHLNISYENFYGVNLRLFVNNLFNTVYYNTSNRPPDRYRQPQRSVLLKIEYNFYTN